MQQVPVICFHIFLEGACLSPYKGVYIHQKYVHGCMHICLILKEGSARFVVRQYLDSKLSQANQLVSDQKHAKYRDV